MATSNHNIKHGYCRHGQYPPEYGIWAHMKDRCLNPRHQSYANYGGRGILVCAKWRASYEQFIADVGMRPSPDHSLDRYPDPNGNYEPGNVRWATALEQSHNRRDNVYATINNETKLLATWIIELGLNDNNVRSRIARGMSPEDALTKPFKRRCGCRRNGAICLVHT